MSLHPAFIDLVATLLVIFMMLATLAGPSCDEAVERSLPPVRLPRLDEVAAPGVTERDRLTVTVVQDSDGLAYLAAGEPAGSADAVVRLLREAAPAREILFRADAGVPYGDVLRLLAQLSDAGFFPALAYEDGNPQPIAR